MNLMFSESKNFGPKIADFDDFWSKTPNYYEQNSMFVIFRKSVFDVNNPKYESASNVFN